jgi:hypothetical protein
MNKAFRIIQNYLIYAFPFMLLNMGWGAIRHGKYENIFIKGIIEVLDWNLMLWFAALIIFLIFIVSVPMAREKTLKRLANLKERDEREEYITGKALRGAYLATLSLLIFLLFMSIFNLNIYKTPESKAVDGKTGVLSIGLGFKLLDEPKVTTNSENKMIFETKDIPLSKTAILLILLFWQVASFNLYARREYLKAE